MSLLVIWTAGIETRQLRRKDTEIRARSLQGNFGLASKISTVVSSPCIHCVQLSSPCLHALRREANRPCPSQEADQEFCSSFRALQIQWSAHCQSLPTRGRYARTALNAGADELLASDQPRPLQSPPRLGLSIDSALARRFYLHLVYGFSKLLIAM